MNIYFLILINIGYSDNREEKREIKKIERMEKKKMKNDSMLFSLFEDSNKNETGIETGSPVLRTTARPGPSLEFSKKLIALNSMNPEMTDEYASNMLKIPILPDMIDNLISSWLTKGNLNRFLLC